MVKNIVAIILLSAIVFAIDTSGQITLQKKGDSWTINNSNFKNTLQIKNGTESLFSTEETTETLIENDLPLMLHEIRDSSADFSTTAFIEKKEIIENPILIAVIDTGIDFNNNELAPFIYTNENEIPNNGIDDDNNGYIDDYQGYNFVNNNGNPQDDYNHGTLVSGIAIKNSMGTAKIIPIKAFDSNGHSSQFIIATAIQYAIQMGAQIINSSFGYPYTTETLRLAVKNAQAQGITIIASAGNNGNESSLYPAAFAETIAVSSLDAEDKIAGFSNYGSYIDISCLGVDVTSTTLGNGYKKVSGTSISAGYLSGITALGYANLRTTNFDRLIREKAIDIIDPLNTGDFLPGWDKYSGNGKLELSELISPDNGSGIKSIISSFLNYPNPIKNLDGTQFGYFLSKTANVKIMVLDLQGNLKWQTTIKAGDYGAMKGYNKVSFDCFDQSGAFLPNDTYIAVIKTDSSLARQLLSVAR